MLLHTDSLIESFFDKVAEWLKKLNTNRFCSVQVPSNPIIFALLFGCMLKWLGLWTLNSAIRV